MKIAFLIDDTLTDQLTDIQTRFGAESVASTIRRLIREYHAVLFSTGFPHSLPLPGSPAPTSKPAVASAPKPELPARPVGRPPIDKEAQAKLLVEKMTEMYRMSDADLTAYVRSLGYWLADENFVVRETDREGRVYMRFRIGMFASNIRGVIGEYWSEKQGKIVDTGRDEMTTIVALMEDLQKKKLIRV